MIIDLQHTIFMIISLLVIVACLVLFGIFIKNEKKKELVLKIFALLTVFLHYSNLWVDYFMAGSATISNVQLLPIYPCHISMWLLVICAFIKNKKGKLFKILAETLFYLGLVGGVIGIALNENYMADPNLLNWHVLQGLLSHVTLLIGCIYLLVGKFIKIRVSNTISCIIGLSGLIIDGLLIIGLHQLAGLNPPNAMYLLEIPFKLAPWINTWTIGLTAVVLIFSITAVHEQIHLRPEDRWYNKFKKENKREVK